MLSRRLFTAAIAASLVMGAGPKRVPVPEPRTVASDQIRASARLSGVSGWILVDLHTGKVLDAHNADQTFAPASVAKLPTAAFALAMLGHDHRFETELVATGAVAGGRVAGDLVLRGGGDPELDTDGLANMIEELKTRGVKAVAGAFLADGSALPQAREIEPSQAVDASYNPSVSGLNLNFNRVHVKWDARKGHNKLSVEAPARRLSPVVERIRVSVGGTGPLFRHRQTAGGEHWTMAQRAFRGQAARWLPVKRPEVYAAEVFRTLALGAGLELPDPRIAAQAVPGAVLASHASRPLGQILRSMLRYSTNVTAEVTGAAAARARGVEAKTLAESAAAMNDWAAEIAGFPKGDPGFRFVNHSGLTLDTRVSPRRMADLLIALARENTPADRRHALLPGAIAGYLKSHNVAAKSDPMDYDRLHVVAKTGTMNYVRGLAGYIATPGGRQLAFAIFSNDLDRRTADTERVDRGWLGRARGFENALIRNWVRTVDRKG